MTTLAQELRSKVKNLREDLHTTANQVKIGDNVWEHGIVSSIIKGKDRIVFNADSNRWEMQPSQHVMITARIENDEEQFSNIG